MMSLREDPLAKKLCAEIVKNFGFDESVKLRRQILLHDIQQNGIFAPMDPEHCHRIRMKKLDWDEAKIALDVVMMEKGFADQLENFEEQLRNYRSWERRMRTVWPTKSFWFIRKQLEFTTFKIEQIEGRIEEGMATRRSIRS